MTTNTPMRPADEERLRIACELAAERHRVLVVDLQRRMWLTFSQAQKLLDEMERRGLISPPDPETFARTWVGGPLNDSNNGEQSGESADRQSE